MRTFYELSYAIFQYCNTFIRIIHFVIDPLKWLIGKPVDIAMPKYEYKLLNAM